MTDTLFVAGATGLTGRWIVEQAARANLPVVAHVRRDSPRLAEWQRRFSAIGAAVDTSPWEASALRGALGSAEVTHVFACLGTTQARARRAAQEGRDASQETYEAVDVALTELLIAACRGTSIKRFVYLSSVGAGEGAAGAYLLARTRVEHTLQSSSLPFTIVRPSIILGDRDEPRTGENVAGVLADGGLSVLGLFGARKLRDRYRSIQAADLAAAMLRLGRDPAWQNRIAHGEDLIHTLTR